MKKFLIASDHAGFEFKEALKAKSAALLAELGYEFEDLGTHSLESVDYTDYAKALHIRMTPEPIGLLICGSGIGISIKANRFPEIRAVLAQTPNVARLGREHNHANVLCMGARIVTLDEGVHILKAFLEGKPDEGERHVRRIDKLYEC